MEHTKTSNAAVPPEIQGNPRDQRQPMAPNANAMIRLTGRDHLSEISFLRGGKATRVLRRLLPENRLGNLHPIGGGGDDPPGIAGAFPSGIEPGQADALERPGIARHPDR